MSKASDAGKAFLAGVLAKVPDAHRANVQAAFDAAESEAALEVLGTGALAQPEISRRMDELKAQGDAAAAKLAEATNLYERNQTWYTANQAALAEYPALKAKAAKGGGADDDDDLDADGRKKTPPLDPRAVALEVLNEQGRDYVQVSAWLAGKAVEHMQRFSEPLDTMAIVNNPKLGKPLAGHPGRVYSLNDAYTETYGERVTKFEKDRHDKGIEDEVQKRLTEERTKHAQQPFPLRGAEPSVLDILATKDGPAQHTVDSAVAEYDRLQAAKGT